MANTAIYSFSSPRTRATLALVFLGLLGLITLVAIASNIAEISLLQKIERGELISPADAESNDNRQAAIGIIYLLGYIATIIAFLFWIHRASKNLEPLGVEYQEFSPGWAIGWWFIPIMSLFRPYQVMKEIWAESHPRQEFDSVSPLLGPWWVMFLVSGWVGNIGFKAVLGGDTVRDFITADWIAVASDIGTLITGILVAMLIFQITSNQKKKHAALTGLDSRLEGGHSGPIHP